MTLSKSGCDLLFGQSYYLKFDEKLWEGMQPFPPLGTLIAASLLRENGYHVALFDAMLAEGEHEWEKALQYHKPAIAVVFEDNFNYLSKMCLLRMRQAALAMVGMARKQGCTVIVAGADASDHPMLFLENGADYVLIGEGDYTLVELVDHVFKKNPQSLHDIKGLAWSITNSSSGNRDIIQTGRRSDIRDLDEIPFPAWDLVDIDRYRKLWREHHGYFAINMVTTRGCPFHCNWCAKPIWGQRYNVRSPENVFSEMVWLKDSFNPDYIWFVDDIFGLKPGWLARFSELITKNGLKIPFKCLSRVDLLMREGEIEALRKIGADIVWVGAESGSQKILDAMEKGTSVEQIYQAAEKLHQEGLRVGFFLQFGYPGETRADIEKTLQMVRDCQPDDIGISVSYPLPGTGFFQEVKEHLGEKQNWFDSDDLAMLFRGPFTTEFYRQLHVTLHREFRLRKSWRQFMQQSNKNNLKWLDRKNPGKLKLLANLLYYMVNLPFDRIKLDRLSKLPHQATTFAPDHMTQLDASLPSPQ